MDTKVSDFNGTYAQLKAILQKYESATLRPQNARPDNYELVGPPTARSQGRDGWFGALRIGKRYVSYHFMPVYAFPDLLAELSPALKKRMQGKSCFNFTKVDESFLEELARLMEKGYQRFRREGLLE